MPITKSRKRLSNRNKKSSAGDAQAELEDYLYGEMRDEEEEQHGGDNERGKGGREDILETKEHEVRIRSDVVRMVLNEAIGPDGLYTENSEEIVEGEPAKNHSAYSAICNVLLSNIRLITRKDEGGDGEGDNSPLAKQPIAQLHSLRYTIFLMKALAASQRSGSAAVPITSGANDTSSADWPGQCQITHDDLMDLLFDQSYLIKRFDLQGPYDAAITHLSNWHVAFDFQNNLLNKKCKSEGNNQNHAVALHLLGGEKKYENKNDGEHSALQLLGNEKSYEQLVSLIVSALHSHLKTTLTHTGYRDNTSKKAEGDDEESTDTPDGGREAGDGEYITTHNSANIVANCLEIGRALHHLGVCLGRRQRDGAKSGQQHSLQNSWEEGPKKGLVAVKRMVLMALLST